jgi:DNA-binding IclR family transcriptional regulator
MLDHLARVGEASVPDLARALGLSESTALRAARRLCAAGRIERAGAARATRYRLRG